MLPSLERLKEQSGIGNELKVFYLNCVVLYTPNDENSLQIIKAIDLEDIVMSKSRH